jgi:hypothetical protein
MTPTTVFLGWLAFIALGVAIVYVGKRSQR